MAVAASANAQTMIGAKVGLNYSIYGTSEGDDVPDGAEIDTESSSGIGFHVGGYFQYNFSESLGIRPELLFSMRNTKEDLAEETSTTVGGITSTSKTTGDSKGSLGYIEIPVLLAIQAGDHLGLHIGPGVGILMSAKYSNSGSTTTSITGLPDTTTDFDSEVSGSDAKEGLRGAEVGLCAGAVYELESGLNFGLRYWRGLSSLNEETDLVKTHANVFQFSIGWNFSDNR